MYLTVPLVLTLQSVLLQGEDKCERFISTPAASVKVTEFTETTQQNRIVMKQNMRTYITSHTNADHSAVSLVQNMEVNSTTSLHPASQLAN